jgi:hypothetical protein
MEKGCLALKQRESIHFGDFWHTNDDFVQLNATNIFSKLKKHPPTNLYMLYLMAQSVALVCVEIDKKRTPQGGIVHCHWKSIVVHRSQNQFSIQILNFDFIVSKIESHLNFSMLSPPLRLLLAQPTTPQRAIQKPYLQGTGAPRHYPHTLIK